MFGKIPAGLKGRIQSVVLTCGSRPRLDPPPTATTGSPVWADTNSSMGARGARLGGGGLSSSKTSPWKDRSQVTGHVLEKAWKSW